MRASDIWTHARATRFGLLAGMCALLIWPVHAVIQNVVRPIFIAALAVSAICGASILFMTILDLLTVSRDRRVLPARIFDLAFGSVLTVPAGLALWSLIG